MVPEGLDLLIKYINNTFPVAGIGRVPKNISSLALSLNKLRNYFSKIVNFSTYGDSLFLGSSLFGNVNAGQGPGNTTKGEALLNSRNINYNYGSQIKSAQAKETVNIIDDAFIPNTAVVQVKKIISLNLNKYIYIIPAASLMKSIFYLKYELVKKYNIDEDSFKLIAVPGPVGFPNYMLIVDSPLDEEILYELKEDGKKAFDRYINIINKKNSFYVSVNLNRLYELDVLQPSFGYKEVKEFPKVVFNGCFTNIDKNDLLLSNTYIKTIGEKTYFVKEFSNDLVFFHNFSVFLENINKALGDRILTFDEFLIRNSVLYPENLPGNLDLMLYNLYSDYILKKDKIYLYLDKDNMNIKPINILNNFKIKLENEMNIHILVISDKIKLLNDNIRKLVKLKTLIFKDDDIKAYLL